MKLFMIIYLGANLAGSIGPLPYGIEECRLRIQQKLREIASDPEAQALAVKEDLKLRCEYRTGHPEEL